MNEDGTSKNCLCKYDWKHRRNFRDFEEQFQEAGVEVEREECSEVDVDFFDDADACIIATYTYGDGELPLNLKISLMN